MKFPSDTTVLVAKVLPLLICNPHSGNNQEYWAWSKNRFFFFIGPEKETLQNKFNLGRGVIINMQSSTKLPDSLGPKVSLHFFTFTIQYI